VEPLHPSNIVALQPTPPSLDLITELKKKVVDAEALLVDKNRLIEQLRQECAKHSRDLATKVSAAQKYMWHDSERRVASWLLRIHVAGGFLSDLEESILRENRYYLGCYSESEGVRGLWAMARLKKDLAPETETSKAAHCRTTKADDEHSLHQYAEYMTESTQSLSTRIRLVYMEHKQFLHSVSARGARKRSLAGD